MQHLPFDDLAKELGARAQSIEPLAPHTTFRIGGPAALYVIADTLGDLAHFVRLARTYRVPIFILGNGSNLLVRDGGIRALVIENHCNHFDLDAAHSTLFAESGASLPLIANRMSRLGWTGLEWAIGVPGTVGAAIVGNAGAHGGSIADNLQSVTILDAEGIVRDLAKSELGFGYRTSRFKKSNEEIILTAAFELRRDDPGAGIARMNAYTEHRRRTQPTEPSVGSMFKNPPGKYAGRIIEQAELKGKRVGNVEVSRVHANFFVNHGGASAKDVLELIAIVRAGVRAKYAIELELEIEIVGEE